MVPLHMQHPQVIKSHNANIRCVNKAKCKKSSRTIHRKAKRWWL